MSEVMSKTVVAIDYPRQNETIASQDYTFCCKAMEGAVKVEVSIDGSAWLPCRQAGDGYWYDWSGYASGEHELVCRVQLADGHLFATERRQFSVELDPQKQRGPSPRPIRKHHARQDVHKHMVSKCVVVAPNKPAIMRQLTQLLSREGVNIDCLLTETFGDVASCRFLLEKENGLRKTLESEGFQVVDDKVFRVDLPNRPGEIDQLTMKLAEQGVAIRYMYGTSHGKTTKVVLAVDRPEDAVEVVQELDQRLAVAN